MKRPLRSVLLQMLAPAPTVSSEDVVAAFRVFLGRRPESSTTIQNKSRLAPDAMIREVLGSGEFISRFAQPLLADGPVWIDQRRPPADLLEWISDFFELSPQEAVEIVGASSWRAALGVLFRSAGFAHMAGPAPLASWDEMAARLSAGEERAATAFAPVEEAEAARLVELLLHRRPRSPEELSGFQRLDAEGVFNRIVSGEEFALALATPVLAGAPCWIDQSSPAPAEGVLAWVGQFLSVTAWTVGQLGSARSWRDVFLALFADPSIRARLDEGALSWSAAALVDALTARPGEFFMEAAHLPSIGMVAERADIPAYLAEWKACVRASGLFDPPWYRRRHPGLEGDEDALIEHYLLTGSRSFSSPGPAFDEARYVYEYPEALAEGLPGLVHSAHRAPKVEAAPDPTPWRDSRPDRIVDLERIRAVDFFARFRFTFEGAECLDLVDAAAAEIDERAPAWISNEAPTVSIIIPVYGQTGHALSCLESLAVNASRFKAEVIVYDDASPERMGTAALKGVSWARYIRGERNLGFLQACNAAARHARGDYILLLNSDVRVCEGWLDELMATFAAFPKAGLVGSKLFNADGTLQEAGGVIWRDASGWNYGKFENPDRPEYCFARRVDFCSGAAIVIPTALWNDLGGFDEHFMPAYYEDTDLAFRVRRAEREVWFQPLARALHYEGKTHGRDETTGVKAHQVANRIKFEARWRPTLGHHAVSGHDVADEVNRTVANRMLVLDAGTPMPDRDAGSVLTLAMMRIFRDMGFAVSFAAAHNFAYEGRYNAALAREGIETLCTPFVRGIDELIAARPDAFDVILVFRHNVLYDILDKLRAAYPLARVIFHNVDLHYLRLEREALLEDSRRIAGEAEQVRDHEMELVAQADCTIVTSAHEAEVLREELPDAPIVVYPYTTAVNRTAIPAAERLDLIFIGGYRHTPNVDAVQHLVKDIWPLLEPRLPAGARLLLVGPEPPPAVAALESERILVTGHVPDLAPLLDASRVLIAPLRFGAGVKGKVVSGLANGVPVVASAIAVEATGLTHGAHLLVCDTPAEYCEAVLSLYADEGMWSDLQEAGYRFVQDNYSTEIGTAKCREALDLADATWKARRALRRQKRLKALTATEPADAD